MQGRSPEGCPTCQRLPPAFLADCNGGYPQGPSSEQRHAGQVLDCELCNRMALHRMPSTVLPTVFGCGSRSGWDLRTPAGNVPLYTGARFAERRRDCMIDIEAEEPLCAVRTLARHGEGCTVVGGSQWRSSFEGNIYPGKQKVGLRRREGSYCRCDPENRDGVQVPGPCSPAHALHQLPGCEHCGGCFRNHLYLRVASPFCNLTSGTAPRHSHPTRAVKGVSLRRSQPVDILANLQQRHGSTTGFIGDQLPGTP